MAEPEDLILEGAHAASRVARDIWRRYAPPAPAAELPLRQVRSRLELFLNALFGAPLTITSADPPAPMSWLARLADRASHARIAEALPGCDHQRIYLPPSLGTIGGEGRARDTYLVLAVEQGARLVRGSAARAHGIADPETRDRFLLADAAIVDQWIVREAPGLIGVLLALRREALERRPADRALTAREQAVERAVREVLASDPARPVLGLDADSTLADAVRWADTSHAAAPPGKVAGTFAGKVPATFREAYRGVAAVWVWGRPVRGPAGASPSPEGVAGDAQPTPPRPQRVTEMRRRPRVREAAEDEDDEGSGSWVIRADEPQESVEDPYGLQRPTDRSDDADPEGLGDSLSELPEARVVRTPGRAREVLLGSDELPRTAGALPKAQRRTGIAYPEWDYQRGAYRHPGAIVRETEPAPGDSAWVASALQKHGRLVRRVRTRFERLRPRRMSVGRQPDGPELDIAACITTAADLRAGGVVDDRLYVMQRPARRELRVALLVDVSASTDSWVAGHRRIVDVEKEALLVVCEALDALGDRYGIYAFSGEGPEDVSLLPVKTFAERTSDLVRRRIAALDADRYTRLGAAIRHATAALSREAAGRRLLLILSDGKPNDVDAYEGRYGIEDARQAVAESRVQNVHTFCLTVDREAPRYAPRIFGASGFALLHKAEQLPVVLIDVLRRLVRP